MRSVSLPVTVTATGREVIVAAVAVAAVGAVLLPGVLIVTICE